MPDFKAIKRMAKTAVFGPPGMRVRRVLGGPLRGYEFGIDTANDSMRLIGFGEREITRPLTDQARRAAVACDIGANTGWYTLLFALQPNIHQVYAFDADAEFLPIIEANLRRNGEALVQKTTMVAKFVGNRDDDRERWCKIDTVMAQIDGPIAFKVDVDGGELEVLKGARETLREKPCSLIIETHSVELERDCIAFLQQLGYHTRVIKNAWYRMILREDRNIPHNRWMSADKNG